MKLILEALHRISAAMEFANVGNIGEFNRLLEKRGRLDEPARSTETKRTDSAGDGCQVLNFRGLRSDRNIIIDRTMADSLPHCIQTELEKIV